MSPALATTPIDELVAQGLIKGRGGGQGESPQPGWVLEEIVAQLAQSGPEGSAITDFLSSQFDAGGFHRRLAAGKSDIGPLAVMASSAQGQGLTRPGIEVADSLAGGEFEGEGQLRGRARQHLEADLQQDTKGALGAHKETVKVQARSMRR